MRYRRCECKKNPERGTPRSWAAQASIHLKNYREDPTSTLERDFAVMDLNKIAGESKASERLRADARRAAALLHTAPLSEEAWHAVHSLFPSATGYRKSHYLVPQKRNPYLPSLGFDAGSVWMHTGRTKVEPVEFLGYTQYGAGEPSQVEVRALDGGRTFQTTVDRLRAPRTGEVTTRGNPSAVYGAFRANPEIPDVVRRCTYGILIAGQNTRITAADLYPLASPADKAHIERLCRNGSSYSGESGDVLSSIWAKLGWPMPNRPNPRRKNPASPLQQMQLVARQVAAFKKNYHIPKRRQEIARAIVRMLDKHPMSGQAIPWDVLGGIRSAAREAEHTKPPMVHIGDRVQFFAPGETIKSGQVVGISGGECAVQVGNYAYSVKPHDIRRVYR